MTLRSLLAGLLASPDEGGTVVLRPDGDGFVLVGSVPPQSWQELAADMEVRLSRGVSRSRPEVSA